MKVINDPKIEVDAATANLIAETLCKEIEESRKENAAVYSRAERCEDQYNQVTKWQKLNKVCDEPWPGAADYFVALTEWIVDAVWARVLKILFGDNEPYMTAVGVEAFDVDKAPGVTDFVDTVLREVVKIEDNTNFFFKQIIKLPFAVLKYDWAQEYDRIISKESAQTFVSPDGKVERVLPDDPEMQMKVLQFVANGYQPGEKEDVWVSVDKEIINGPKLQYIKFADYEWSGNAKKNHRLHMEGDRFWLTHNEMALKVIQKKFRSEAVDKLRDTLALNGLSGAEAIIKQRGSLFECHNVYCRLPFNKNNEIDFQDPEALEQEVHAIVEYKNKQLLYLGHWAYERLPFPDRVYMRGMFEETENFEGRSLAEKLYMCQKELNTLHNTIMNNAQLVINKIFVKRRSLQDEAWEKPTVFPGAMWEEDIPGEIRVLEVGDIKAVAWELEQSFINFAERVSNISIYQTGTSRQEGQKTKGEVMATIYEGNIGLDKLVQRCHNILKMVCQWTVAYYAERMPPGFERRIRGDSGDLIFPTQANLGVYQEKGVNPYWSSDDLAGKFDFVWKGTTLSANKEYQITVANDLMERMLPQPMVSGNMVAVWEILRENLIARGKKDWQKYLPPKEAILAEMKRMEEEARLKKVGPGAMPPREIPLKSIKGPVTDEMMVPNV